MNGTWADEVAEKVLETKRKEYVCEGMYTPSGYFHIGNARSEIFTPYAVHRALQDKGAKTSQVFVLDDFDAVRKIPSDVKLGEAEKDKYMGVPIYFAQSPIKGFDTWKAAFTQGLEESIESFGLDLEIVSAYKTYKSGKFNGLIKESLDKAGQLVEVWNRVSGSEKPGSFLPLQVICDSCKKTLYSTALKWDGKNVEYKCKCGHSGKKSPFDGNAKLHWRVHWCAHWILRNIAYESAGKDHFSKGGSVDVGQAMMKEVFQKDPPLQTPTEFILVSGAKMSGSVGNVVNLKSWMQVSSPDTFRYLNFSYRPNKQINFSFNDNSFILLVEGFERAERIYYGKETAQNEKLTEKIKRNYLFSKLEKPPEEMPQRISYQFASFLSQLHEPEQGFSEIEKILLDSGHIEKKFSDAEKKEVVEKLKRAKHWAENYAPERHIVKFAEEPATGGIKPEALKALKSFSGKIPGLKNAEELQKSFYAAAEESGISPKEFFQAAYLALLGKNYGPKIGTLILALGRERVKKRLEEL